jgi:hypothetical protein
MTGKGHLRDRRACLLGQWARIARHRHPSARYPATHNMNEVYLNSVPKGGVAGA